MQIEIKYHGIEQENKLQKIDKGDWIDLRSAEDVDIIEGEYRMISLGVSMRLPDGYEAHVLPRSSTFKNFGIIMVNGMGIIDNSYSGTNDIWRFPAYCLRGVAHIKKGDRIAQFRIMPKMHEVEFVELENLDAKDRGGFGSTGIK